MKLLAVLLVVLGIAGLADGCLSGTRDTVVDAGPIQITADNKERVSVSPFAGGLILVMGVVLLLKRTET